jgi:hypothetical protein
MDTRVSPRQRQLISRAALGLAEVLLAFIAVPASPAAATTGETCAGPASSTWVLNSPAVGQWISAIQREVGFKLTNGFGWLVITLTVAAVAVTCLPPDDGAPSHAVRARRTRRTTLRVGVVLGAAVGADIGALIAGIGASTGVLPASIVWTAAGAGTAGVVLYRLRSRGVAVAPNRRWRSFAVGFLPTYVMWSAVVLLAVSSSMGLRGA